MSDEIGETEYEFQPFETIFLRRREEILQLVGISTVSLQQMEGLGRLSEVLRHESDKVEHAQELERIAKQQIESDFPLLHGSATILIWGALEAATRDFLIRVLHRYPLARTLDAFKRVKVRIAEYELLQGEDRMRYLVGILARETASPLRPGAGGFDSLLSAIGVFPKIKSVTRRDLNEMAAVRNVIVHCASVADARFVEVCAWLNLKKGERVCVSGDALTRYIQAASDYAASVVESARLVLPSLVDTESTA
ncbi:MAG: hypothetical protein IID44_31685 [Planctomycetes bacterium]|nr:hypothetical protein [Planctomycetota bacterium]